MSKAVVVSLLSVKSVVKAVFRILTDVQSRGCIRGIREIRGKKPLSGSVPMSQAVVLVSAGIRVIRGRRGRELSVVSVKSVVESDLGS
jgi:hypothetical protein